jgi:hypothetical protein
LIGISISLYGIPKWHTWMENRQAEIKTPRLSKSWRSIGGTAGIELARFYWSISLIHFELLTLLLTRFTLRQQKTRFNSTATNAAHL